MAPMADLLSTAATLCGGPKGKAVREEREDGGMTLLLTGGQK